MQATIEPNRKDTDETLKNLTEDVTMITSTIKSMMDQNNNMKSSPSQKDISNPTDPTTVVPANRRDSLLDGGHYTKNGGMWKLKHETSSEKFYELLIKTIPCVEM